jgi:FkbM family methyltransferase
MSWTTNSFVLMLRSLGRQLGLNRLLIAIMGQKSYENKFFKALLPHLKDGDYLWDVGANIGYYTRLFADIVGSEGKVFAFEPSPKNFSNLLNNLKSFSNVILLPYGLGDKDGKVVFEQGRDELGATSRIVDNAVNAADTSQEIVDIYSGDHVVDGGRIDIPNVVKIDVEGFEFEVLTGMKKLLEDRKIRTLGIEVHFGLLKERGMSSAPRQIEVLLREAGFLCSWPDSSHIIALRDKE